MTSTAEKIAVMQAFLDGRVVEWKKFGSNWAPLICPDPVWDWSVNKYRVKPIADDSINWDHVHPNFNYMARDADDSVFLYKERPEYNEEGVWMSRNYYQRANVFSSYKRGDKEPSQSLVRRP